MPLTQPLRDAMRGLLVSFALLLVPAAAAQDAELERIPTMELPELEQLVTFITTAVGQDTLKMRNAASARDCLELIRSANAFALSYTYLAAADKALQARSAAEALPLRSRVIQTRVITFAARTRAEEWLGGCRSYEVPEDLRADPRYAPPARLAMSDYTEAVIEARLAAEANLAGAVAAGMSRKCPETRSAGQAVALFVPYLEKLINDVASRPQALGPRASRNALVDLRTRLVAAGDMLRRQYEQLCAGAPAGDADAPAPSPADDGAPPDPAAP